MIAKFKGVQAAQGNKAERQIPLHRGIALGGKGECSAAVGLRRAQNGKGSLMEQRAHAIGIAGERLRVPAPQPDQHGVAGNPGGQTRVRREAVPVLIGKRVSLK